MKWLGSRIQGGISLSITWFVSLGHSSGDEGREATCPLCNPSLLYRISIDPSLNAWRYLESSLSPKEEMQRTISIKRWRSQGVRSQEDPLVSIVKGVVNERNQGEWWLVGGCWWLQRSDCWLVTTAGACSVQHWRQGCEDVKETNDKGGMHDAESIPSDSLVDSPVSDYPSLA